jgi:hypothetical protein
MSNYLEEFISPTPKESPEERNQRFAKGEITEKEVKEYWFDPSKPFFEYELPSKLEDAESGLRGYGRSYLQKLQYHRRWRSRENRGFWCD